MSNSSSLDLHAPYSRGADSAVVVPRSHAAHPRVPWLLGVVRLRPGVHARGNRHHGALRSRRRPHTARRGRTSHSSHSAVADHLLLLLRILLRILLLLLGVGHGLHHRNSHRLHNWNRHRLNHWHCHRDGADDGKARARHHVHIAAGVAVVTVVVVMATVPEVAAAAVHGVLELSTLVRRVCPLLVDHRACAINSNTTTCACETGCVVQGCMAICAFGRRWQSSQRSDTLSQVRNHHHHR